MYNILVANRDEFETKGIQWLLNTTFPKFVIYTAKTTEELIQQLEKVKPSLLILELDILEDEKLHSFHKAVSIMEPIILALTIEATFEKAKKAIDLGVYNLLIKPVLPEVLLKSIRKIVREILSIKENKLKEYSNSNHLNSHYEQLFLERNQTTQQYIVIGLRIDNIKQLSNLHQNLADYPFKEPIDCFILSDMVICLAKRKNDIDWNHEWKRFFMSWFEQNRESIAIVIHNGEEASSIRQRYIEIKQMMEETFYIGYNQILEKSSLIKWEFIDPFLTPAEQRLWIDLLNHSNIADIKDWLYQEFLQFTKPYPDPGLVRIRLTSILAQIRRHMKTFHIHDYEKDYLQLFQSILYSPVIFRIVQEMMIFITNVIEAIKTHRGFKQDIIGRVLYFLESNYWNSELTLEDVASYVDRNPSYLSSQITKITGKTFREVLNEIRLNQSNKLLLETNMSIKEIAKVCGYKNQQYFHKVFKKMKGVSPTSIRNS